MPVEVGIGAHNGSLRTGLEESKHLIEEFKEEYSLAFTGGVAELVSAGAVAEATLAVTEYGHRLEDLHERFDVSTQDLQQFGYAALQNGASLDSVALAFNRLAVTRSRALAGNKEDIEAFYRLGVSIEQLKAMSPAELMLALGRSSMDAGSMVQLLGRNALELEPTLRKLADGSQQLGQAMSDNVVKGLAQAQIAINEFKTTATVAWGDVVANVITPAIKTFRGDMFTTGYRIGELMTGPRRAGPIWSDAPLWKAREDFEKSDLGGEEDKQGHETALGADGGSSEKAPGDSLQDRLAKIDADAAVRRMTLDDQLAALQNQKANIDIDLGVESDPAERRKMEEDVLRIEQEIQRVQTAADRQHEESVRRANEERLRSEREYQQLKAQNDRRATELAIETEDDPERKKQLVDNAAAQAKDEVSKLKDELFFQQSFRNDPDAAEKMRKQLLDAEERLHQLEGTQHEIERPDRAARGRESSDADSNELEQIGLRLSGADYSQGDDGGRAARNAEQIEKTAYYTQKTYEQLQLVTLNGGAEADATFGGE